MCVCVCERERERESKKKTCFKSPCSPPPLGGKPGVMVLPYFSHNASLTISLAANKKECSCNTQENELAGGWWSWGSQCSTSCATGLTRGLIVQALNRSFVKCLRLQ